MVCRGHPLAIRSRSPDHLTSPKWLPACIVGVGPTQHEMGLPKQCWSRQTVCMTRGQQLLEDLERQRRAGDPRLTEADRAILERITTGDLVDEFAAGLAAVSDEDPLLRGRDHLDD